jgi:MFS family permease
MVGFGLRYPLQVGQPGDHWYIKEIDLPFGWRGRRVLLVAVAGAHGTDGGFSISDPLPDQGTQVFDFGFYSAVVAFALNGFLLFFTYSTIARWIDQRELVPTWWTGLVAGAGVALIAYATFWGYFFNFYAGLCFSIAVIGTSLAAWVTSPPASIKLSEWPKTLALTACLGVFYMALLYLYRDNRDFYDLASSRLVPNLPGDNRLPHDISMLIYHGLSPKSPGGDWLSSDRPPLECAWQLLTWPITKMFGFAETTTSATSAVWLQLLWVPAVYGLLRSFGLNARRSSYWLGIIGLSGFCFLNTIYTWPKMSAGAFACGAVYLWIAQSSRPTKSSFVIAGGLAALALLSHGGVAFAFIALLPLIVVSLLRFKLSHWPLSAAVFLGCVFKIKSREGTKMKSECRNDG